MHIPDGFLSTPVWVGLDVATAPAVGYLARRAQRDTGESRVALLGVMGAFVFAAQMINFPVGVGTSGHLVGGALLGIMLGPAAAAIVMTAILAIQALVFQDGGLLALGANVFNMAIAGVLAGYLPFHLLAGTRFRLVGVFAGGALSVIVSAVLAVAQLAASGIAIPAPVLGLSAVLFMVTACVEGAITVGVFQALARINPGFAREPGRTRPVVAGALLLAAVLLAAVGVLFASTFPDGLEGLAARAGIAGRARTLFTTPFADYEFRLFGSSWAGKAAAGLGGLMVIYGLGALLARLWRPGRSA